MPLNPVEFRDFTGGIHENDNVSPSDFTKRQWAELTGFVLEDEVSARSQWALQRVSTAQTGFKEIRAFKGRSRNWMLGIKTDGTIWYCQVPNDDASNATTAATVWTQAPGITADTNRRFICELPFYKDTTQHKTAVLIHTVFGSSAAVYMHDDGAGNMVVYQGTDFYATKTKDAFGNYTVSGGKSIRCNVGTMWKGFFVAGDILWLKDPSTKNGLTALTAANTKRYNNYIHISQGGLVDAFDPIDVAPVCSGDAAIVGMTEVDAGLLIFTTRGNETDGVILMRGDPTNPTLEVVRGGFGVEPYQDVMKRYQVWSEVGDVAFVDYLGGIWHTDGNQVRRLDEYGPRRESRSTQTDNVCSIGPYLFVSRNQRMLVMRAFFNRGSWTSLLGPGGATNFTARSMTPFGRGMYFLDAAGSVYRYAMAEQAGTSERGLIEGVAYPLTVSTQPVAKEEYSIVQWRQCGVRAQGLANAQLNTITSRAGAVATTPAAPSVTTTYNTPLTDRASYIAPVAGPSVEHSVTAVFQGDVRIETISMWYAGGKIDWGNK